MVSFMNMKKRMKISKGGQVSIPLEDRGGEIVLKPVPDDPIAAAAGAFAGEGRGLGLETIRREEREAEREIEERKYGP